MSATSPTATSEAPDLPAVTPESPDLPDSPDGVTPLDPTTHASPATIATLSTPATFATLSTPGTFAPSDRKFVSGTTYPNRAGCILFDDSTQKVLCVCNRASQKWGFPKGHQEKYESIRECALRELREETSVVLDFPSLHHARLISHKGRNKFFLVHIPSAQTLRCLDRHDENEISDIQWFTLDELASLKISKVTKFCIDKVRSFCRPRLLL